MLESPVLWLICVFELWTKCHAKLCNLNKWDATKLIGLPTAGNRNNGLGGNLHKSHRWEKTIYLMKYIFWKKVFAERSQKQKVFLKLTSIIVQVCTSRIAESFCAWVIYRKNTWKGSLKTTLSCFHLNLLKLVDRFAHLTIFNLNYFSCNFWRN